MSLALKCASHVGNAAATKPVFFPYFSPGELSNSRVLALVASL